MKKQITVEMQNQFRDIMNQEDNDEIDGIIIAIITKRENLVNHLLLNNISFNYLVETNGWTEMVPMGWKTNGTFQCGESVTNNKNCRLLTIAMAVDKSVTDMASLTPNLKPIIDMVKGTTDIGKNLRIGKNIHLLSHNDENTIIRSFDPTHAVDTILKYFKDLL